MWYHLTFAFEACSPHKSQCAALHIIFFQKIAFDVRLCINYNLQMEGKHEWYVQVEMHLSFEILCTRVQGNIYYKYLRLTVSIVSQKPWNLFLLMLIRIHECLFRFHEHFEYIRWILYSAAPQINDALISGFNICVWAFDIFVRVCHSIQVSH